MYFVCYNKDFESYDGTFIAEKWTWNKRSYDLDDMEILGESIPDDFDPFIIVLNDKRGHPVFSGLAGTPSTDDSAKKTTFILKDFLTVLNSEIIVNWSTFSGTTLADLFTFVLNLWKTQNGSVGITNITFDTTAIASITLDADITETAGTKNINVMNFMFDNIFYYNVFCEKTVSVTDKEVIFTFKKVGTLEIDIKLSDFGINKIEKTYSNFNKATVYNASFVKQTAWYITAENEIAEEPTLLEILPPIKNKNFVANSDSTDDILTAKKDALIALAENRYNESFELDIANRQTNASILENVDFETIINIYGKNGFYKKLPIGEILTDSKNNYKIKIGYKYQEITQIL